MKTLNQAQKDLRHGTLKLPRGKLKALAALLVEFAEDLHCGIGLWRSVERHHAEAFGTPLPFIRREGAPRAGGEITPARLQHFLWVMYPQFHDGLILAPGHVDLIRVAEIAAEALRQQYAGVPPESAEKAMLGGRDDEAWDVKRELI